MLHVHAITYPGNIDHFGLRFSSVWDFISNSNL